MRSRFRYYFSAAIIGLCFISSVKADGIISQIYTSDEPLLLEAQADGSVQGLFTDFFERVAKEAGRDVTLRPLPWKRAQAMTHLDAVSAIGPLTRTPERDKEFKWIGVLFPMRIVYLTLTGYPKITTLEEARLANVAVKGGSASMFAAKKHGLSEGLLHVVSSQELIINMLIYERVDAWLVWDVLASRTKMEFAPDLGLEEGYVDVLGDLYLAASTEVPDEEIAIWSAALDRVKASGGLSEIRQKYLGVSSGS